MRWAARKIATRVSRDVEDRSRSSAHTKMTQRLLVEAWRTAISEGRPPALRDTGFRVFSQFEEDGLLLFILTVIGPRSRTFLDIGAADGINSNCANLALNHDGWHGVFIDGNPELVARGEQFYDNHRDTWAWPPCFVTAMAKRENINEIVAEAGLSGEIDVMSIDIDGNDYWIWDALTVVQPRVVIIETNITFGTADVVVPYDPDYVYPGSHPLYHGASPVAMEKLARKLGYRLVGSNAYGFNTIYVRGAEGSAVLPAVEPETVLSHPRNTEWAREFAALRGREYVRGGTGFPGRPAEQK